jgi:alkylhydroperoxidase/carboxymuconolactone decarboxylase family protein YurZ
VSNEKPRNPFADIAPALGDYTDKVLFGDVWKRPGLSPRDRSLVTVASLVSLYRTNELPFHLKKALENGVTRDGRHAPRVLRRVAYRKQRHRHREEGVRG